MEHSHETEGHSHEVKHSAISCLISFVQGEDHHHFYHVDSDGKDQILIGAENCKNFTHGVLTDNSASDIHNPR